MRCAIAVDGDGTAWVGYCANRHGRHDLYVRPVSAKGQPGREEKLTAEAGSYLNPVMCTDAAGNVRLACQVWGTRGKACYAIFRRQAGRWVNQDKETLTWDQNDFWHIANAAGAGGEYAVAYDHYTEDGHYDLGACYPDQESCPVLFSSPRFEARPSICYDAKGRLWIAYEEGPEKWGHDYGALASGGEPLYSSRSVRVVCLDGGKLMKPIAELPTSTVKAPVSGVAQNAQRFEKATRYSSPRLGLDGKGRLWLTYRQSFGSRYSSHLGSYWLSFARRLDGDKWSEPIEVHHADGLLDSRPAMLPHAGGGLLIVHNTDGRYTTPEQVQNRIYTSYLDLPGEPVEPKLAPHEPGRKDAKAGQKEQEDVKRSPRLSPRNGRQQVSATARRIPPAHGNVLGRRCRRLPGRYVSLRPRRGGAGLDRQRRSRQRRRPRILVVADAEVDRRLSRQGPLHAAVLLRAQRLISARPSQLPVRAARRPHVAATGRAGAREARGRHPRRRHEDALSLPEGVRRHLRCAYQRHRHGHRLARQRSEGGADRRNLPGRSQLLRDGGGAAPATIPRAASSRPTSPAGIPRVISATP